MGSYHRVLVRPLKMEENRHLLGELERCLGERRRLEMLEECALLERCRALQAEHAASEADAARQQENIARSLYLEMERGAHDAHRLERELAAARAGAAGALARAEHARRCFAELRVALLCEMVRSWRGLRSERSEGLRGLRSRPPRRPARPCSHHLSLRPRTSARPTR